MKIVVLLDNKISDDYFQQWRKEDVEFWNKYTGIVPTYGVMRQDFSDYPTYIDSDGDIRPTNKYLQSLNNLVTSIHGQFGVDFIMMCVHEDNWKSDPAGPGGIWGTNYSYVFGKQTLQYCRWDGNRRANTFGTLYHERHHSLDAIIKQELGVNIEPLLDIPIGRYDSCITHGKCAPWQYIRYKENVSSLKKMKVLLTKAFQQRREQHQKLECGEQNVVMRFLNLLYYIFRMKLNKKDGVKRD